MVIFRMKELYQKSQLLTCTMGGTFSDAELYWNNASLDDINRDMDKRR